MLLFQAQVPYPGMNEIWLLQRQRIGIKPSLKYKTNEYRMLQETHKQGRQGRPDSPFATPLKARTILLWQVFIRIILHCHIHKSPRVIRIWRQFYHLTTTQPVNTKSILILSSKWDLGLPSHTLFSELHIYFQRAPLPHAHHISALCPVSFNHQNR